MLPLCRWRREPTAPGRHMCLSPKLVVGPQGVPDEGCASCYCRDHEPLARGRGQCVHLGPRTGMVPCPPCSQLAGRPVSVPLHQCQRHGSCTIARESPGQHCCLTCADHTPAWRRPAAGGVRHLTYHVYPRGDIWRWNVAILRDRLSLFNGRRIVGVATDGMSDDVAAVREALGPHADCEIVHVVNDIHRREMTTHPILLERMSDLRSPQDATWYGHAKGIGSSVIADGVRTWAEAMYVSTLDYWPEVRRKLIDHAAVGCLTRRTRHPPGVPVSWHYSGSFRWLRNPDIYCRDWTRIQPEWLGPETYPGLHIGYEESACMWGEHASGGHGYALAEWSGGWRGEAFAAWQQQHAQDLRRPMLMSVVIRAHQHPARVHEAIASVMQQTSDEWDLLILDSGRIHATGAYDRYRGDARIRVRTDPEGPPREGEPSRAARRLNEAHAAGLVRGDLVLHLPDDDLLSPRTVETLLARARVQHHEGAWYGRVRQVRVHLGGDVEELGPLNTCGTLTPLNRGRGRVDGMQVCYRRDHWTAWPVDPAAERTADGFWMDALAERSAIVPLDVEIGVQRHTAESYYTH